MLSIDECKTLPLRQAFELGLSLVFDCGVITRHARLLICGPSRSGKDTVAQWFALNTPLRFNGTSSFAGLHYLRQVIDAPISEIYRRRHEFSSFLYHFYNGLRDQNVAVLPSMALENSDILCGVRSKPEMIYGSTLSQCGIYLKRDVPVDPTQEFSEQEFYESCFENCIGDVRHALIDNNRGFDYTAIQLIDLCKSLEIPVFPQIGVKFERFGISFA